MTWATTRNWPGRTPPLLKIEPSDVGAQGPAGTTTRLSAWVPQPVALNVWETDDRLPTPSENSRGLGLRAGVSRVWSVDRVVLA